MCGKMRTEHPAVNGVQVVGRHLEVRGVPILKPEFPLEEPRLQSNGAKRASKSQVVRGQRPNPDNDRLQLRSATHKEPELPARWAFSMPPSISMSHLAYGSDQRKLHRDRTFESAVPVATFLLSESSFCR
jgi:hypothetical protein